MMDDYDEVYFATDSEGNKSRTFDSEINVVSKVKTCMYVGSFPVATSDHPTRVDYIRAQLEQIRETKRRKPVLLVISLAGIKICSVDGKNVFMAHALRRISYATCDSEHCQFSFLAREPKGHFSLQYCHSFLTESTDQAEELNTIVGNAFRTAYVAQLQKEQQQQQQQNQTNEQQLVIDVQPYAVTYSPFPVPNNHRHHHRHHHHHHHHHHPAYRLLQSQPLSSSTTTFCDNTRFSPLLQHRHLTATSSGPPSLDRKCHKRSTCCSNGSSTHSSPARNLNTIRADWGKQGGNAETSNVVGGHSGPDARSEMNLLSGDAVEGNNDGSPSSSFRHRLAVDDANGNVVNSSRISLPEKPRSLPGLQSRHARSQSADELLSPSSVSSDDTNSPTELNSYKRLLDKPPLVKRFTISEIVSPDDELRPLVRGDAIRAPSIDGYVNEGLISHSSESLLTTESQADGSESPKPKDLISSNLHDDEQVQSNVSSPPSSEGYMDQSSDCSKMSSRSSESQRTPSHRLQDSPLFIQHENGDKECQAFLKGGGGDSKLKRISLMSGSSSCSGSSNVGTPPPLPERYDSLQTSNFCEEKELRKAPWFQAGIPREIALEILAQEPVGAFMVRESTSKPGCYALSLRVPREFQPTGIAHYLIMKTNKGYKIKGFTKEFVTLTALITHHSVMPELLPCPLSLSRYNPNFSKHDSNQDFADMDDDPDYNTLSDFRKMMADLSI